jgi:hypothetical protein
MYSQADTAGSSVDVSFYHEKNSDGLIEAFWSAYKMKRNVFITVTQSNKASPYSEVPNGRIAAGRHAPVLTFNLLERLRKCTRRCLGRDVTGTSRRQTCAHSTVPLQPSVVRQPSCPEEHEKE